MAKYTTIPIETLRQVLRYNPETGQLFWKPRPPELFKTNGHNLQTQTAKAWNTRYANKETFVHINPRGYLTGHIFEIGFRAHRICWAIYYGEWPEEVDHLDHNSLNNKLNNLVSGSHAKNLRNQSRRTNNTSGICGVWKQNNSWVAEIKVGYQKISLGSFASLQEAAQARKSAEIKYGFHPNHGLAKEATQT